MHFEKVSEQEWNKAFASIVCEATYEGLSEFDKEYCKKCYDNIKLPQRSTKGSAGYDFYTPFNCLTFGPHVPIVIPTGIRWIGDPNQVLLIVPRSGLGFKFGVRLLNTVGVIDSDYANSDNEGHIMCKLTADTEVKVNCGQGIVQGIIVNYAVTDNDKSDGTRNGGFGSTDE